MKMLFFVKHFHANPFLLFFAAYVKCKKKYSVGSFFPVQNCQLFYSKINDSSRVRTTGFPSSRSRVRVSVVPSIFMISQTFIRNSIPMVPLAQWIGQQDFEAVGTSSNPSLYLHFFNFINTTENRDTPFYARGVSRPEFF